MTLKITMNISGKKKVKKAAAGFRQKARFLKTTCRPSRQGRSSPPPTPTPGCRRRVFDFVPARASPPVSAR